MAGVCAAAVIVLVAAAGFLQARLWAEPHNAATFILIILALACALFYAPDYLHVTVNPHKRERWAVRVRWRIALAVLVLAALVNPDRRGIVIAVCASAWIVLTTLLAQFVTRYVSVYYAVADLLLIFGVLALTDWNLPIVMACWAAAEFIPVAISSRRVWWMAATLSGIAGAYAWVWLRLSLSSNGDFGEWRCLLLPILLPLATALLVRIAGAQNHHNVTAAMAELVRFTGYTAASVRALWATADKQLAHNWQAAKLDNATPERMAEWYRENSELYMFAISAYNLEYKRIRSNLKVLRFGREACLDYGAGNGDLILELARRSHRAAYYDVDGVSKRFAQHRAEAGWLQLSFTSSKEELRTFAPFDTIFSFDVLEHIPDLAGELDFLVSLLAPSGLLLFDVPAGATHNHPMHLNHTLDVRAHLRAKGMREKRVSSWRIGKQEKYGFTKPQ